MHTSIYFKKRVSTNGRKFGLSLSAIIAMALLSTHVSAQWVVVDPSLIGQEATNFGTTVEQYAKDIAQYQAVLQHYQQQLVSLTHMNFGVPTMQNNYQEISSSDAQQQVQLTCPSSDGSVLSSGIANLLQIFTPDVNSSIVGNQLQICQQIAFRRIDKYNLTVKMMNRLQSYASNLQSITGQLDSVGTSQGAMDGVKANVETNGVTLQTEMSTWNSQMMADDQIIAYLQNQQGDVAKAAFRGSNTILGNLVQAAALKAAFSIN